MAALSKPQPFGFDVVIEQARAAGGQRLGDRRPRVRRAEAEQAAATAGGIPASDRYPPCPRSPFRTPAFAQIEIATTDSVPASKGW